MPHPQHYKKNKQTETGQRIHIGKHEKGHFMEKREVLSNKKIERSSQGQVNWETILETPIEKKDSEETKKQSISELNKNEIDKIINYYTSVFTSLGFYSDFQLIYGTISKWHILARGQ